MGNTQGLWLTLQALSRVSLGQVAQPGSRHRRARLARDGKRGYASAMTRHTQGRRRRQNRKTEKRIIRYSIAATVMIFIAGAWIVGREPPPPPPEFSINVESISTSVSIPTETFGQPTKAHDKAPQRAARVPPGKNAAIFAEPDAGSEQVGIVPEGEIIVILGRHAEGRWLLVEYAEGRFGWVGSLGDDPGSLYAFEEIPVVTPPAQSTPSPTAP